MLCLLPHRRHGRSTAPIPHAAQASASGEELRAIQDGVVTERSRSERRANPDGSAPSQHSYAPTSVVGSEKVNMDSLMMEPPRAPMQVERLGEPNATVTAEQRNMQFNAFDNRQSSAGCVCEARHITKCKLLLWLGWVLLALPFFKR